MNGSSSEKVRLLAVNRRHAGGRKEENSAGRSPPTTWMFETLATRASLYRFLPPACLRLTTWKRAIKTKIGSCDVELFTPLQPAETRALQGARERSSRFMDLPVRHRLLHARQNFPNFLVRT